MEKKEQGFIKKELTLVIDTRVGSNWQNRSDCQFTEAKNGYIIIEPKEDDK